jgi:predicted transcriptional regulator
MTDKKMFATRVNEEALKQLKHLAVDTDKSLGALFEEAIQDLLEKYRKQISGKKR